MLYFVVELLSVYQIYQIYSFYFQKHYTYLLRTHASFPNILLLRYLECSKNNFIQINHCHSRKPIFYICCLFSDKSNCVGNKFCWRFFQLVYFLSHIFPKIFFRDACLFYCILLILDKDRQIQVFRWFQMQKLINLLKLA